MVCHARVTQINVLTRETEQLPRTDVENLRRAGSARLAVTIDTDGRMRDLRSVQNSGSTIVDDMLLRHYRSRTFQPQIVDGFQEPDKLTIDAPRPRWCVAS